MTSSRRSSVSRTGSSRSSPIRACTTRPAKKGETGDEPEDSLSEDAKENPFRFQGFYYDSGVKTYDMRARSYRPELGRFLTSDRFESASGDFNLVADPLTQNRYAFAGGNPVTNVEWDGHDPHGRDTHARGSFSGRVSLRREKRAARALDQNHRTMSQTWGRSYRTWVARRPNNPARAPQPSAQRPTVFTQQVVIGGRFGAELEVASTRDWLETSADPKQGWLDRALFGAVNVYGDPLATESSSGGGLGKAARSVAGKGGSAAARAAGREIEEQLTGQIHHAISRKVHAALQRHPKLRGHYVARDPRFETRAKDLALHRGYQRWHRDLDDAVAKWVEKNPTADTKMFERYLRNRYARPDLSKIFPRGLPE